MSARVAAPWPGVRLTVSTVAASAPPGGDTAHPADQRHAYAMPPWRRAEFLAGRALLRRLLAAVAPQAADAEVVPDRRGRPELAGWPVGVSVAHDRGVVAAAVALGRSVGVDVQQPAATPSEGMARRLLGPRRALLAAARPEVMATELAWIWTAQEACVKAAGTGIAGKPWQIDVAPYAGRGRWGRYLWVSLRGMSAVPLSCAVGPAGSAPPPDEDGSHDY
ncbi:4'-phosphopantetheinyl transferase superfamily protein [Micromonospora sp. NPDC047074]|uniref:4'-phosphopantetheinyl transferase family protein n=1 Tax=Micromonospora sp. NPDC047074 TaxID=3154339 RepID=UPI0033C082D1